MIGRQVVSRARARIFGSDEEPAVLRRRIVRWCFFIYWLLIFEGVLRKWVAPQISNLLFFVRDPFLLWVYWLAMRGPTPRGWPALAVGLGLATVFFYVAGGQIIFGNSNLLVAGYGWRSYFLYFPLAWVIYTYFEREDVNRLMRQTLFIAVPIAALVAAQFYSPTDSWINKGTAETGSAVFEVTSGIVRPYGTFTFVAGQSLFVASAISMLMANALVDKGMRFLGRWAFPVAAAACAVMLMLSGSRTAFILSAFAAIFGVGGALIGRGSQVRLRGLFIPGGLALLFVVLYPVVFPTSFNAIIERQNAAVQAEGATEDRAVGGFIEAFDALAQVPLFGYGLGFGTAGGAALAGMSGFTLSENEFPRILEEVGPIFGALYVAMRLTLAAYLLFLGVRAARDNNDPSVLCICGFTFLLLATMQVTFEGTVNGFAWIFVGISLALARFAGHSAARNGA